MVSLRHQKNNLNVIEDFIGMLKKSVLFLYFLLGFQTIFASATIISTKTFNTINQLILKDKHPHHTLLAMDDDDTLTMMPCPSSSHCQYLGGPAWFSWQESLSASNPDRVWKSFNQLIAISNLLFNMSQMTLTDPAIPGALRAADQRGVSTLVMTDRGYRMIYPTENQFAKDDILAAIERDAVKTKTDHISMPGFYFPSPWKQNTPRHIAYEHGILYVSGQNKGVMLHQFLNKTDDTKQITHIIFVDDTYKNDQDVFNAYKNDPKISVTCVYFTRLKAHKAAFTKGKNAKKLQAIATQQWQAIRTTLSKNLIGFTL